MRSIRALTAAECESESVCERDRKRQSAGGRERESESERVREYPATHPPSCIYRSRANVARIRQSRPGSGQGKNMLNVLNCPLFVQKRTLCFVLVRLCAPSWGWSARRFPCIKDKDFPLSRNGKTLPSINGNYTVHGTFWLPARTFHLHGYLPD